MLQINIAVSLVSRFVSLSTIFNLLEIVGGCLVALSLTLKYKTLTGFDLKTWSEALPLVLLTLLNL
jgi:hypothetical protein